MFDQKEEKIILINENAEVEYCKAEEKKVCLIKRKSINEKAEIESRKKKKSLIKRKGE